MLASQNSQHRVISAVPPSDISHASWIETLKAIGTERAYDCDETLLVQGGADQGIRYIITGTAHAISLSANGEETWLGKIDAGEFLGEVSHLTGDPMEYDIVAASEMRVISVTSSAFQTLLEHNPHFYRTIANGMAVKLKRLVKSQVEAITLSAFGRICAELERMARPIGVEPRKLIIRPNPVFSDLGARLGTSRETVSRTVSDLQKRTIISRTTGAIIIERPAALKALVK